MGGGSDLCEDLVGVRLRRVRNRHVLEAHRGLAGQPFTQDRLGAVRPGTGRVITQLTRNQP